jgi:biotin-dependent carboxylase-like uncharacterized protein
MIEVISAGLCDLVMGSPRRGFGSLGVPAGGAADPGALAAANALVGNYAEAAGLEIVLAGPTLRFPDGAVVALTGGRFAAQRSCGAPVSWNETLVFAPEETLTIARAESGCRCWLAVQGGISVPSVMESRSTFLPAAFGGLEGRRLRAGDRLPLGKQAGEVKLLRATPPAAAQPGAPLRVVVGPQAHGFQDAGLTAFFNGRFRVASSSDRQGLRLEGPPVPYAGGEGRSQGVLPGAVQIPANGQPIILGWDGPVTGGYPVIAGVISADLPRVAQLRPGDALTFTTIEVERARASVPVWKIEELA